MIFMKHGNRGKVSAETRPDASSVPGEDPFLMNPFLSRCRGMLRSLHFCILPVAGILAAAGCMFAARFGHRGIFAGIIGGIGLIPVCMLLFGPGLRVSGRALRQRNMVLLTAAGIHLLLASLLTMQISSGQKAVVRAFIHTSGAAAQEYILPECRLSYIRAVEERTKLLGENAACYPASVFRDGRIDKVETNGIHAVAVMDDGFVFQLRKVCGKWYIVSVPGLGELPFPGKKP